MRKEKKGNISLYIHDKEMFYSLCDEVSNLWYSVHGQSTTKSETIVYALLFLKQTLRGEKKPEAQKIEQESRYKFSRISS